MLKADSLKESISNYVVKVEMKIDFDSNVTGNHQEVFYKIAVLPLITETLKIPMKFIF